MVVPFAYVVIMVCRFLPLGGLFSLYEYHYYSCTRESHLSKGVSFYWWFGAIDNPLKNKARLVLLEGLCVARLRG